MSTGHRPPANQQYFSLTINQHQLSAISQPASRTSLCMLHVADPWLELTDPWQGGHCDLWGLQKIEASSFIGNLMEILCSFFVLIREAPFRLDLEIYLFGLFLFSFSLFLLRICFGYGF
jgi:hypothetical protein